MGGIVRLPPETLVDACQDASRLPVDFAPLEEGFEELVRLLVSARAREGEGAHTRRLRRVLLRWNQIQGSIVRDRVDGLVALQSADWQLAGPDECRGGTKPRC